MKLEEIHNLWEEDSQMDASRLDEEALNIPKLHSKYTKIYSKERMELLKLEAQHKPLKLDKREFYTQGPSKEQLDKGWSFPGGKILKNEVDHYLDADSDIIKLELKISIQKEKLHLLDSIVKTINNRSFHIGNAIEWIKWTNGQN